MKYRELTPNEIEAYNIGYKVGARQIFITDIEWENDTEHKIYRKGYLAGCKDRHRNNVNNVNNVKTETMSNSEQCQNRDSDNDTDIDTDIVIEEKNKGGVGEKRETIDDLLTIKPPKPKKKDFVPPTLEEWRSFCKELKLDPKRMESIYYGYSENDWRDSHGNQIKNWKMKIRQVWDKPENKDPDADVPKGPKIADMNNFVRAKRLGDEE